MKIWIINEGISIKKTGNSLIRYKVIARELAKYNHKVTIITSRYHHLISNFKEADIAPQIEYIDGFRFIRIDAIKYKNSNDKLRVLHWIIFSLKLLRIKKLTKENPDIIYFGSPAILPFLACEFLAKRFQSKLFFEFRDIYPLTLNKVGGFSNKHPLMIILKFVEERAYKNSDLIISTIPGAYDYLINKKVPKEKYLYLPNGIDDNELDRKPIKNIFDQFLIPSGFFTVCYSGSMNKANFLVPIIESSYILKSQKIFFIFIGDGIEKNNLEKLSKKYKVKNIIFTGNIKRNTCLNLIDNVDICIQSTKKNEIYKYGVSSMKIIDYLSSGKPIIHCFSGNYDLVKKFNAGYSIAPEDPYLISQTILKLRSLGSKKRKELGINGKLGLIKELRYSEIVHKLNQNILNN